VQSKFDSDSTLANVAWSVLLNRNFGTFWNEITIKLPQDQLQDLAKWYYTATVERHKEDRPDLIPSYIANAISKDEG